MASDEIVSGADGDGDGFSLQVGDRLELRPGDQSVKRGSKRQGHKPDRRSGDTAAGDRAGAEGVVDVAGLQGADSQGRAHGDDFSFNAMLAVKAALLGGPGVEKAERLG